MSIALRMLLLVVVCQNCLMGCGQYGDDGSPFSGGSYSVSLQNRTGKMLSDCVIHWGELEFEYALAPPNGLSSMAFYNDPVPATARIVYTTPDGRRHDFEAPVSCREGLPASASDAVIVLLPDDEAAIEMITDVEAADRYSTYFRYRIGIDEPQYIVATYNATQHRLDELAVYFGDYHVNAESEIEPLSQDLNAGWRFSHGLPYPITDQARVSWTTEDGRLHDELVDIPELPDDLHDMCIVIVIDDPVRVTTVPWGEEQYWWMNTKP